MTVRGPQAALVAIVLAALVAAPLFSGDYLLGVLTVALIYVIWAMSWDFFTGLSGRENFGYQLFIGVGAYATAFLDANYGVSPWIGLGAAVLTAAAVGVIIGFPTLRLRGPYFALATLAAAEITQHMLIILWEFTGGEDGVSNLTPLFSSSVHYYYFVFAAAIASTAVLVALTHSRWGLLLRAIRGDEAGCQAAGINVTFYKIAGLVVSAAFAGLGGALYASYQLHVGPNTMSVTLLIAIASMVYVGGLGTVYGAIGGAIVLTLLGELLRDAGEYRLLVYAVILILVIFFMKNGFVAPLWKRLGKTRGRSVSP
jgi:branched-chain amino acid transport system permease protein